jgi:hypothetical protein
MKFTIYQESRLGRRHNNEDRLAHCYSREALLMVVADGIDRKSTRLNSSHNSESRMPSSA